MTKFLLGGLLGIFLGSIVTHLFWHRDRFEIVSLPYETLGTSGTQTNQKLLKFNVFTGEAFELRETVLTDNGTSIVMRGWFPMTNRTDKTHF